MTVNHWVTGSSPVRGAIFSFHLMKVEPISINNPEYLGSFLIEIQLLNLIYERFL